MKYVIIGNGIAGTMAAETIRQIDTQGEIKMISDENNVPYSRPLISNVLAGLTQPNNIQIRNNEFYEKHNIETCFGQRVKHLCTKNKQITTDSDTIHYDRLLIASGADARPVKAQNQNLKNIFFMRNLSQVQQILKALPETKRALVLGGGLVGFKAASAMVYHHIPVSMVIGSDYPLSMQVDRSAGEIIYHGLQYHGIDIILNQSVQAFEGKEAVQGVYLSDGSYLACDLVIIGKGVLPSKGFVSDTDIQTDLGIIVDQHLATNISDIFAAGDVAQCIDIVRKTSWVNAIWPEAVLQGRIAGANMAGKTLVHKGSLGRNVIRLFDMDILTAGLVNPPDDSSYKIVSHHGRFNFYRKMVFKNNLLVGIVMVNGIELGGMYLSHIANEIPV